MGKNNGLTACLKNGDSEQLLNIAVDIRPLMGGKISGVEMYTHHLLKNLFELDRTNHYILFANASGKPKLWLPEKKYENVSLVQTNIPNKLLNFCLSFARRPKLDRLILQHLSRSKFSKDALSGIDVFLSPDLRLSALSRNVQKIQVVHDLSFHHFPQFFSFKSRLWYKLLQPRREINKSQKIIAVSAFTKNDLIKTYHLPSERISVIYEGVEEDFGQNISPQNIIAIKKKYQLPDRYFLFLATLEPRKNMHRLLEAFRIFKQKYPEENIQLVMAGLQNNKIFSSVTIAQEKDIFWPGFIKEEDKAALMKGAQAFLYPSLFEGFGLPLVEAMKCQTPIITSNQSSMPEITGSAALLVNPQNIEEIAEAMHKILDPSYRQTLQAKMAERVKIFSWEKAAKQTLKIIESLEPVQNLRF